MTTRLRRTRSTRGFYYCSSATSCTNTRVAVSKQPMNPVAAFPSDNNGTIIRLPGLSSAGAGSATGQVIFGIGTQQNNTMPSGVNILPLNQYGYFTSVYKGRLLTVSAVDSGTNMFVFPDSAIPISNSFYVPAAPLALAAIFQAASGAGTPINVPFEIANANNLYASGNAAFNNFGMNASGMVLWGCRSSMAAPCTPYSRTRRSARRPGRSWPSNARLPCYVPRADVVRPPPVSFIQAPSMKRFPASL